MGILRVASLLISKLLYCLTTMEGITFLVTRIFIWCDSWKLYLCLRVSKDLAHSTYNKLTKRLKIIILLKHYYSFFKQMFTVPTKIYTVYMGKNATNVN